MKKTILNISIFAAMLSGKAMAVIVNDEFTLQQAVAEANADSSIETIVFEHGASIALTAPVIYSGAQDLTLIGNGALIDGSAAGSFVLDDNFTAVTEDGTLVFNTAGDITIRNLTVANNATRGIVVNVPEEATGDDVEVVLHQVKVLDSALYGLHIDDNRDAFDDGVAGSAVGVDMTLYQCEFTGNGTGAIDFDGVRVDERGEGDIQALIIGTTIDGNGGDGIELDEAGPGDVDASMIRVSVSGNGFFNEADLDDGFDIDEADEGNVEVTLNGVTVVGNQDEGLDFDEAGEGDVELKFKNVFADANTDEGIKIDEEDAGDIESQFLLVDVANGGDDGIQFTELGEGGIEAGMKKVTATNNEKFGIKIEQWFVEDEPAPVEEPGELSINQVTLSGNGKGDEIELNNVIIE